MELSLFRDYLDELSDYVAHHWSVGNQIGQSLLSHPHLNGAAADVLLKSVPYRELRKYGIFFTSSDLAINLLKSVEINSSPSTAAYSGEFDQ
jgi:hypothetical protein